MPDITPLTVFSRLASENTKCGDLPPNSSVAGLTCSAATPATFAPPISEPVKVTLRTFFAATRAAPASLPSPVTTFINPAGVTGAIKLAKTTVEADAISEGLMITALPAASAGATFHAAIISGEFQAVIAAITP